MKNKKIVSIMLSISLAFSSVLSTTYVTKAANSLHGIVISKHGLNVRSECNTTSKIIGALSPDDSIEILETVNDWYKIKLGSSYGYVSKQYVKLDTNTSTNTTNTKTTNNTNTTTPNTNTSTTTPPNNTKTDSNSAKTTDTEYKNLSEQKNVDKLKQWKVKFNKNIKNTESNQNQFKVVDSKGNFVSIKVLIDNSTVTIVPWDSGYSYEEKL